MIYANQVTTKIAHQEIGHPANQLHYDHQEISFESAVFLTDESGQDTCSVSPGTLKSLGLNLGIRNSKWFPLTNDEATYTESEIITLALRSGERTQVEMARSALINNEKYLAPTITLAFDNRDRHSASFQDAQACSKRIARLFEAVCQKTGGHFATHLYGRDSDNSHSNPEAHGHFTCSLFIPMEYAKAHSVTFPSWIRHLSSLGFDLNMTGATIPLVSEAH